MSGGYYSYGSQYDAYLSWYSGWTPPGGLPKGAALNYSSWMQWAHGDITDPGPGAGPFSFGGADGGAWTFPPDLAAANEYYIWAYAQAAKQKGNNQASQKEANLSPANGIIPVLYGRRKIPGLFVYINTIGTDVHIIYIFCEGEIQGFESILVNDKLITEYGANIAYETYTGTASQTVCGLASYDANWNDPLLNIAYVWLRINMNGTIKDLPKVEAFVQGKKVYDPRIASNAFTSNPALCLADALTNTRYGGRVATGKINWGTTDSHPEGTVWDAADYCELPITNQTVQKSYIGKLYGNYTLTNNYQAETTTLTAIYVISESPVNSFSKITISNSASGQLSYETYNGAGTPPTQWQGWDSSLVGKACVYITKVYVLYSQYFGDLDARYSFDVKAVTAEDAKKYGFAFYFGGAQTLRDVIETIRRHYLGLAPSDDGQYSFYVCKPRSTSADFVEKDVWGVNIPELQSQDIINRVTWTWTDPDTWEAVNEEIEDPNLTANDEIHEAHYDLTGCLSYSQSKRIATFLLNSRLSDLTVVFNTHNSKGLQVSDVFSLTHSIGLTNKLFYVAAILQAQDGSYSITGREYDPAFFSDAIISEPTYPDTSLPNPASIPDDATNLILSEELTQLKDATWISVIKATWTASIWPFVKHYEIWAKQDSGDYVMIGTTTGANFEIRAVLELANYSIAIVTVSEWKIKSGGLINNIIPQGKYLPPVWKSGAAINGTEAGDVVFLYWYMADDHTAPATDIDIIGYELRRGFTTDSWDTAHYIGFVSNALIFNDSQAPTGTWRYFLKAKDSVGNYTATAIYVDIAVSLNPNIGFQNTQYFDLAGSTLTTAAIALINPNGTDIGYPSNSYLWSQRFTTSLAWNSASQPYPLTSYPQWLIPVPASGTIITQVVDLATNIGGQWTLYYTSAKIGAGTASITPKLLLSDDNTNWIEYDASSTFSAKARYVKAKFVFDSTNNNTTYYITEPVYVILKADPKEDYGTASVTGGLKSITFALTFISIVKITLTPAYANDGIDPRTAVYDALTASGMNIRLFDKNNAAASGTVAWKVEGY